MECALGVLVVDNKTNVLLSGEKKKHTHGSSAVAQVRSHRKFCTQTQGLPKRAEHSHNTCSKKHCKGDWIASK